MMRILQQIGSTGTRRNGDGTGGSRRSVGRVLSVLLAVAVVGWVSSAHAAVTIIAVEQDGNVFFLGAGSLNTKAWTAAKELKDFSQVDPTRLEVLVGPTPAVDSDNYNEAENFEGPTNFGTGGNTAATKGSGDIFGLKGPQASFLVVPPGYAPGEPLEGSAIYEGATFESLGLTPGSYTWTWGLAGTADSLTLIIGDGSSMECEEDLATCEEDLDSCDADLELATEALDACEDLVMELSDLDQDGVMDTVDACPQTPEGMEVNADGCSRNQLCESMETNTSQEVRWCMRAKFGEVYDPSRPTCTVRRVGWNRLCRAIRY